MKNHNQKVKVKKKGRTLSSPPFGVPKDSRQSLQHERSGASNLDNQPSSDKGIWFGWFWILVSIVIIAIVVWAVGFLIALNNQKITIEKETCFNQTDTVIEYYPAKDYSPEIGYREKSLESIKIEYLFEECNIPNKIKKEIINYSVKLPEAKILKNYNLDCLKILLIMRDFTKDLDILKKASKPIVTEEIKEVCNKEPVETIEYISYAYSTDVPIEVEQSYEGFKGYCLKNNKTLRGFPCELENEEYISKKEITKEWLENNENCKCVEIKEECAWIGRASLEACNGKPCCCNKIVGCKDLPCVEYQCQFGENKYYIQIK